MDLKDWGLRMTSPAPQSRRPPPPRPERGETAVVEPTSPRVERERKSCPKHREGKAGAETRTRESSSAGSRRSSQASNNRKLSRSHSSAAPERPPPPLTQVPLPSGAPEGLAGLHTQTACYTQHSKASSHISSSSCLAPHTTSSTHKAGSIPHPGPVSSQCKERADKLVAEAEAKLSRSLFRSSDVSGAQDCYQRASAQYKQAGEWARAGEVFAKMGDIAKRQGDTMGGGRLYGESGSCYRKVSTQAAVASYLKSAEMYIEMGKFAMPAKHHEAIAVIYATDCSPPDHRAVIHHLSMAAHYYYSDNRTAARNKCRIEMARLHGLIGEFDSALAIYEDLGFSALDSRMLKYSADEYLFRASLCHLAIDSLNCQIAIQKYVDYYPAFEMSRECKFIKSLCSEVEQESEEGFQEVIRRFKHMVGLDPWYGAVLRHIHDSIPGELSQLR